MINFGAVPAGSVLPIFFDSYAGSTGASSTISGLAVTDIEIYKGTSMTQRSSDNGYTLLDTDGIDLDGITGINGFSVDLGDNTDAGFFAAGSFYNVVVSAITVDSQTVNFVAATFRIVAAENTAGVPVVDTVRISNTVQTARDIGASVLLSSGTGTGQIKIASGYVAMTWADIAAPTTTVGLSGTTIKAVTDAVTLPSSATIAITGNITGNLSGSAGSVTGAVGSVTGNVGGNVTGSVGSVVGLTASDVGAIKTQTDKFVFTVANQVDCNVITKTGFALSATGSAALTEGYRANGAAGTLPQLLYEIVAHLGESAIVSTTKTINKIDHSTPAETFTLDDATTPTSITRAT